MSDARGKAIIGVDLRKDVDTLIAAYDDKRGVTAEFNLNLLARINRELRGTFALDAFAHEARWNERESAIEMHLVSLRPQIVSVAGSSFAFAEGETIHTETCRKFDVAGFAHRRATMRLAGGEALERSGRAVRSVRSQRGGVSAGALTTSP